MGLTTREGLLRCFFLLRPFLLCDARIYNSAWRGIATVNRLSVCAFFDAAVSRHDVDMC